MNELPSPGMPRLSMAEFERFRRFLFDETGIALAPPKLAMVQARLSKRLRQLALKDFASYWRLLNTAEGRAERQHAVNALSTNETFFFREPQQFAWLQHHVRGLVAQGRRAPRLWSAACSTGEEAYTLAMLMADSLGLEADWQIVGSDINTRVLETARRGIYPLERVRRTPKHLWQRYLQYGREEYRDKLRVRPELARHLSWQHVNLLQCEVFPPHYFDLILLRNVMIYFNAESKAQVLQQVGQQLRPGGYLLIGQSECVPKPPAPLQLDAPNRLRRLPLASPPDFHSEGNHHAE